MRKSIYTFSILLLHSAFSFSQNAINYSYDASGNRISRFRPVLAKSKSVNRKAAAMSVQNSGAAGIAYDAAADAILITDNNMPNQTDVLINVYTMSGFRIYSANINKVDTGVSMRDIPYGAYIAVVETDRGIHAVRFTKDK